MKNILSVLTLLFLSIGLHAQDISGRWNGTVQISEDKSIEFVFNISTDENGHKTIIDIPSQRVAVLTNPLKPLKFPEFFLDYPKKDTL
nr:hypothetical protein [uncultured Allomuricauda sp.]